MTTSPPPHRQPLRWTHCRIGSGSPAAGVASSTLLAVLGIALAIGAGAYMLSDTFRARADRIVRTLTDWTPEAIAADPAGYLEFADRRVAQTRDALRQQEVVVRQQLAKVQGMRAQQHKRIEIGSAEIEQLKTNYRAATRGESWPVTYHDRELSQAEANTQLVALDRSVRSARGASESLTQTQEQLDQQSLRIQRALGDCDDQIGRIRAQRQLLVAKQLQDAQTELIDLHQDLVTTVKALGEQPKIRTLDELILEHEDKTSTQAIEEILGR